MNVTSYHEGGFNKNAPAENKAREVDTEAGTVTTWNTQGEVTSQRGLTTIETAEVATTMALLAESAKEADREVIRKTLDEQLATWLQWDRDYLKADAATQAADLQKQVVRLTRQSKNLIKLALDDLESQD